jgi:hypothetical protein
MIAIVAVWLCEPAPVFATDTYWEFSYDGVDVVESRRGESAISIAHNLLRLKLAVEAVMGAPPTGWQPPTQVYSVPIEVFQRIRGNKDNIDSVFYSSGFDNTILADNSGSSSEALFNAYFGYSASVLINEYSRGYPPWFRQGMGELFAASTMSAFNVTVGVARTRRLQSLFHGGLIPVKTLLTLRADDPQMKSESFSDLYGAESWLLVHQIIVEGKYRSNFFHYFALLEQGEDSDKAFAASFDISSDVLDKLLSVTLQQGRVFLLKIDIKAVEQNTVANRLSTAQSAGRLAALAALRSPQDTALQMTNEAIALDAKNQDALWALAYVQLRRSDYGAALQASNALCTLEPLAQQSVARCGSLFLRLAEAAVQKKAELGVESVTLAERSRQYYEKALLLNADDIVAWDGEANLLGLIGKPEYTQAFLPRAANILAARPQINDLSRALARLAASVGDLPMAIDYAARWEKTAVDEKSRDSAAAYRAHLKSQLDRGNSASGSTPQ